MSDDKSNIVQELEILKLAVEKAAQNRLGTFAQRNPMLGRMIRCPHCKQRRRQNSALPCCNAQYMFEGIEGNPPTPKRKNPRLTRHRPPLFLMRQILLELEREPLLIQPLHDKVDGLEGIWTPQKELRMEHLATFVEKAIIKEQKAKAKKYRDMQKESRKVNRGK